MGLAMLGDRLSAEQARVGTDLEVVDDGEFVATTDALVAQLADAPTAGLAAIKRALYASAGNTLEQQLDVERDAQRARLQRGLSRRRGRVPRQARTALQRR